MEGNASSNFMKGLSVQTFVTLSNAILQLVVFALFSRLLSREDFGYSAAIMSVVLIFSSISDAGIGSTLIQKKGVTEKFRSTAFVLSLSIGFIAAAVSVLLSSGIASMVADSSIITPLRILSVNIFLYSIQGFAVASLRKELNFKIVGVLKLTSYIIASATGLLLAYNGMGLYSLVYMYLIDSVLYTLLLYLKVKMPAMAFHSDDAKSIISFGGWLTLGVIVTNISNQLDKLLMGRWLGVKRLGEYNRPAGFITNTIGMANTIFDIVLFPILSKFQDSIEQFRSILYKSVGLLSSAGTVLCCFLVFNSNLIIEIFFGKEWFDLVPVLRILSISAIFMMLNTLADCFFRSFNLVKVGFEIRLFGLFLLIGLLYLGSRFGIKGVAVSTLLSNFIIVATKFIYLSRKSKSSILKIVYLWLRSFVPALPFVLVGTVFIFAEQNWPAYAVQLALFLLILIAELLFFPKILGREYCEMFYPEIRKIVKR